MSAHDEDTHVYIVCILVDGRWAGPVKVGIASSPKSRLAGLQTGNAHRLVLCGEFVLPSRDIALGVERAFHAVMGHRRLLGEWFDINPQDAVRLMCANVRACIEATGRLSAEDIADCLDLSGVIKHERRLLLMGRSQGSA